MSLTPRKPTAIGTYRVWDELFVEFSSSKIAFLQKLNWEKLGRLTAQRIEVRAPREPGIYAFIRESQSETLSPCKTYPLIVYIGKASNIQSRLNAYVKDKSAVSTFRASEKKVRSGIRNMFRAYGDKLDVYFARCPATEITAIEDILIQIFDPLFNEAQKLPYEIPEEHEISATFGKPKSAYPEEAIQAIDFQKSILGGFSDPEPAF